MNREQLRNFVAEAQAMIAAGAVEDRLRHNLSARLAEIFPEHPWWVRAHIQGTEERVRFSTERGNGEGFADAVVGKTAIEYEKNLSVRSIFAEGYRQVGSYTAALCNLGIPEDEVLGVLSDTVRWYGYKVHIRGRRTGTRLLGADDIELEEVAFIDLTLGTETEYARFEQFIATFLARDGSRLLNAGTLVTDFGLESTFYRSVIGVFSRTVVGAMTENAGYAELVKRVWQDFVAYLGVSDYGTFSVETYVREFYLVTVAKFLCVNILAGRAVIGTDAELRAILDGSYFERQNICNFVEHDYFGWLNEAPYADTLLPCAREIQSRLRAYDFSALTEQDIFGRLLAQLAGRENRLMLGQEFTPHKIAREIVRYDLGKLGDEPPRMIDMCCGSGVFLIEAIKETRRKFDIAAERYDGRKDDIIFSAVTGFDIDPLAVMLAKVNWIMAMRDLFALHNGSITVPIYHADSLFVATPITHRMPADGEDRYLISLDGAEIGLPAFLFSARYGKMFDLFVSKVYRLAMARASAAAAGGVPAGALADAVVRESGIELDAEKRAALEEAATQLTERLENLQRRGQNGIWRFILSNSYRPALTEKQFNCIVSNPPWMAMSKLADNPYKSALKEIAVRYALQPYGAAHPHMELATIFLVSSVDRYLKDGAQFGCIMPASVMSGLNHEPFRRRSYRTSAAALQANISSIWELPADTFKNKAVVLFGEKSDRAQERIEGRIYDQNGGYRARYYSLRVRGERTAWTGGENAEEDASEQEVVFAQGCDLFPRTALFHKSTKRRNGNWDLRPIARTDALWYLVSESKKNICGGISAENIEDAYVYDAYISKHLSPFLMAPPAKALIPAKKENGAWRALEGDDLALLNASTAYVFSQIEEGVGQTLSGFFREKIDIYGKLTMQDLSGGRYLVLSAASGANPCAAYIDLEECDRERLVIDQTLYWHVAATEREAIYLAGMLNSEALAGAILDFQPEGGFGKRHIHTLPYRLIPPFDPENELHQRIAEATKELMDEWSTACRTVGYRALLDPDSGALSSRRRRQQEKLRSLPAYRRYAAACRALFR